MMVVSSLSLSRQVGSIVFLCQADFSKQICCPGKKLEFHTGIDHTWKVRVVIVIKPSYKIRLQKSQILNTLSMGS